MFRGGKDFSRIRVGKGLFALLFSLLAGCGGGASEPNNLSVSAQSVGTNLGTLDVGSVAHVTFDSKNEALVSFQGLTGTERFLVAFGSLAQSTGTFNALLGGSLSANPDENALITAHFKNPNPSLDEAGDSSDATGSFHEFLREVEESLPSEPNLQEAPENEGGDFLTRTQRYQAGTNYSLGSRTTIKVLNSLSSVNSYTEVPVTLRKITAHFNVWVDVDVTELSDQDLNDLIDPFENQMGLYLNAFGSIPDFDKNGKVNIVYNHVLNQLGGSGGIVTGFFSAIDFQTQFAASNGGEFLYCHVPDPSGRYGISVPKDFYMSNTGPLCAPHELQHLINYNMKVFVNQSSPESPPFNEGLSHFAEDIVNSFGSVSAENPSRVNLCLGSQMASFISGIGLTQRGCAYLYFRYLFEQAGLQRFTAVGSGAEFLSGVLNNPKRGFEALTSVAGANLDEVSRDYFTAVYLSNTGLSQDPRYNFQGINLRSSQNDNRGTQLNGPSTVPADQFPLFQGVSSMTAQFIEVKGDLLIASGNALRLSGDPSMSPTASVIRLADQDK